MKCSRHFGEYYIITHFKKIALLLNILKYNKTIEKFKNGDI
jgi:hypothetical protein